MVRAWRERRSAASAAGSTVGCETEMRFCRPIALPSPAAARSHSDACVRVSIAARRAAIAPS